MMQENSCTLQHPANEHNTTGHIQAIPGTAAEDCILNDEKAQTTFQQVWSTITDPDPQVLFGFRRFRTSHLLNLRCLEKEILEIDDRIFRAGLKLGDVHDCKDRLALAYAIQRDQTSGNKDALVNKELIIRLRGLLQQYGMCPPKDQHEIVSE
jgi:hypothetical protein